MGVSFTLDLALIEIRINPGASLATFAFMGLILGLLIWVIRKLGWEPVMVARASAKRKTTYKTDTWSMYKTAIWLPHAPDRDQ